MHALIVSAHSPPDPARGDIGLQLRLRLFVHGLAQVFDRLSFLYFVPDAAQFGPDPPDGATPWGVAGSSRFATLARRPKTFANEYLRGLRSAAQTPSLFPYGGASVAGEVAAALAEAPDLIFAQELHALLPILRARPDARLFFDLNDILHVVRWRAAAARPIRPGRLAQALQIPALIAAEIHAMRRAAIVTVCAEADRRTIARMGAGPRAAAVPNAVPLPAVVPPIPAEPTLLYLGNYAYDPNILAVRRLLDRIWPRVRAARLDARLLIAGAAIENVARVPAPEGATFLGFVPDLARLYAGARVVCCPIDVGGGTRLKLIEAAGFGRPMVSTRVGAEGLEFRDGAEILLRDDDAGFADVCAALLADDARCQGLAAAARARALVCYDSAAIQARIALLVREALARP